MLSIQVLNYQVSLTKVILGWKFSLNFMILNARICILTLSQRRSTVSPQTTIDAQMRLIKTSKQRWPNVNMAH